MITAASVSDVAVIVIDASRVESGALKPQTRRHAAIAALMGMGVIVAVNKMDLVGWSQARFDDVRAAFADVAGGLGLTQVRFVPVSRGRETMSSVAAAPTGTPDPRCWGCSKARRNGCRARATRCACRSR